MDLEATNFLRKLPNSSFCHIRFTRPMIEKDHVDIKVHFHETPVIDGQLLLSITPPEYRGLKAKAIIKHNPFVIDPTTAWINNLNDDTSKRAMKFGIKYINNTIQLRLQGETEFFTFYHVLNPDDQICVDIFFCKNIKVVGLFDPKDPTDPNKPPVLYEKRSSIMVV
ncbi:hypothetical protein CAEBREN_10321 [Caenorhabditis brenneri]|uniref:Galectin n=1 Tax=Caenorhabditis brenneri TaxID=135651 RepID=G0MIF9_CAEBE|nr:hypothetical protein CAEBREN_10321 [Caenorhabditis brenneri]